MAFDRKNQQAAAQADDNWKAAAFLNFYLVNEDGTRGSKIGAIPLKATKKLEAAIIDRLSADPDALDKMMAKTHVEFNLVDDPKAKPPVLPF